MKNTSILTALHLEITRLSGQLTLDITNYASYDNIRKIASLIDGLKNGGRKIIFTAVDKNIKEEIKVSRFDAIFQEHTEYLHGSAVGVIVGLAQDYVGTNNLPLLAREGNFGTRFVQEASASRYIFTHKEKYLDQLFMKEDSNILVDQFFEGSKIEPKFLIPTIPMLLVNGSEGISSGFAQKILPRNPKNIIKILKQKISNKKIDLNLLNVEYNGFNGSILNGDSKKQWIIKGILQRKGASKVEISEVPVGYSLRGYLEVLDKLEDSDFIKSYIDKSSGNNFSFEINFEIKKLASLTDEELYDKLKLTKTVSENYTCMSEENKIIQFENAEEIFEHYYKIKLQYMQKRKDYIISKINIDIKNNYSKYIFIKSIIDGNIIVNNKKKTDIITQIEKNDKILKLEDSYDYLLRLPVYSLTFEKMEELKKTIEKLKEELDEIKLKTPEEMWLKDIEELEKALK